MKKTFALLAAGTALSALVGFPAFSGLRDNGCSRDLGCATSLDATGAERALRVADDDHDDDDAFRWLWKFRERHGDDDHDDDDDDDDDDDYGRGAPKAAPAGTVAPPQNGLFVPGATPTVKVN